jgi:hypothetical protein
LFQFLSHQSSVSIEKIIKEYERETLCEENFSSIFTSLEHEHLDIQKVKQINTSLGTFISWAQVLLSYHVMVHPYRIRNRDSILYNLQHGNVILGFAETIDDFMNQFYNFKSFLMRVGFLQRDSHFAFNLSNIHSHKEVKPEAKIHKLNQESFNLIFSFFESNDVLHMG